MKLVIPPVHDQHREHDVTRRLVSAIAEELWRLYGGNDHFNWVEAERHLQQIVGEARAEARESEGVSVEAPAAVTAVGRHASKASFGHTPIERPARNRGLLANRSVPARLAARGGGERKSCSVAVAVS